MQEILDGHDIAIQVGRENDTRIRLPKLKLARNGAANSVYSETFQKVERAKQEWETAVDALPELICVIDYQGRIIRTNRTAEHWGLGPVVSIKGRHIHELLHPGCGNQACYLTAFIEKAFQKNLTDQVRLERYDPFLKRHLLLKVHPVRAIGQKAHGSAAIVVQDISQRKLMEQALHSYTYRLEVMNQIGEAILAANSPQAIARAALSRLGQLVSFQLALLALASDESGKLLVFDVHGENSEPSQPEQRLPLEAFNHDGKRGLESTLVIDDLSRLAQPSCLEQSLLSDGIRSYMSIPLIAQGQFIGAFILGAAAPNGFQQEQVEIAQEVGHLLAVSTQQAGLHQSLEQTNASLERALQAKEEMIQNVSHELRTPLGIISGYANLMDEEAFGALTAEQKNALGIVIGRVDQLEFLVTRLLTLQSLNKNTLQTDLLRPEPLLRTVLEGWQLRAEKAGIQLVLDFSGDLPQIMADADLFTLAVSTLLDNAIKFSPDGGLITISSWAEEGELYVTVSDQGIGIAPDKLDMIFERFVQADGSTKRSFGGMGIGLALCHDIVKAHGGRIWAESPGEGQGSTFTIALPAVASPYEEIFKDYENLMEIVL